MQQQRIEDSTRAWPWGITCAHGRENNITTSQDRKNSRNYNREHRSKPMDFYRDSIGKTFKSSANADGLNKDDLENNVKQLFHSEAKTRWSGRLFTKALEELVLEGILTEKNRKYTIDMGRFNTAHEKSGADSPKSTRQVTLAAINSETTENRKLPSTEKRVKKVDKDEEEVAEEGEDDNESSASTETGNEIIEDGVKQDYLNLVTGCPLLEPRFFPLEADLFNVPTKHSGWDESYAQLLEFKKKHGHCRVPKKMKHLGGWVQRQRIQYRKCRDGEPTTLTRERYLKLREAGFLFWSKGLNSTHYSNSPANISAFNPKDAAEVKELKVLIEQQRDIIKEQKSLVSRYSKQIEEFLIWKDEYDIKTTSLKEAIDRLQVVVDFQQQKISDLEENGQKLLQNLQRRVTKLEGRKTSQSSVHVSKTEEPAKEETRAKNISSSSPSKVKKKKEIGHELIEKGEKSSKSTSASRTSKAATILTGKTPTSTSKSSTSAPESKGMKRKREPMSSNKLLASVKDTTQLDKSNNIDGTSTTVSLRHGSQEAKEGKVPDPELIVRVSLSKSSPIIIEPQKLTTEKAKAKDPLNKSKTADQSKKSVSTTSETLSSEVSDNHLLSTTTTRASDESKEGEPCTAGESDKGKAVTAEELNKSLFVTAGETDKSEAVTAEESNKSAAATAEEAVPAQSNQDEAGTVEKTKRNAEASDSCIGDLSDGNQKRLKQAFRC